MFLILLLVSFSRYYYCAKSGITNDKDKSRGNKVSARRRERASKQWSGSVYRSVQNCLCLHRNNAKYLDTSVNRHHFKQNNVSADIVAPRQVPALEPLVRLRLPAIMMRWRRADQRWWLDTRTSAVEWFRCCTTLSCVSQTSPGESKFNILYESWK
jgi:hypothetical protein